MRFSKVPIILFFVLISCHDGEENCHQSSLQLETLINSYQERESYDSEAYPLGLFTREYYQSEAKYAANQMQYFDCIEMDELSETEQISAKLLKFVLQDKIDYYTFERFLNPLLSDAGFHSNLNYHIQPINSFEEAKTYLNKLNAIPVFVDQHFVNLREGLKKGVSQPKIIFKGYESTYDDHIVDDYLDSSFYEPFKNLPDRFTPSQKDSLYQQPK